ncbi:MAG: DUF4270 family protein [Sphingobacterium sp.]
MIRQIRLFLFVVLTLGWSVFMIGCDKDMGISLDNENIDNLNVTADDTLSAVISTAILPNLPTNGTGIIVVGKVTQPGIGSLEAQSSFVLQPLASLGEIPANAVFDSLNLVLRPNSSRYVYGDTTEIQRFSAYRLTQALETETIDNSMTGEPTPVYVTGPAIFSDQTFAHESQPLGTARFLPQRDGMDSVSMRLSDALGKEFFNKVRNSDVDFNSAANFQEYFKGITLIPDDENTAIVGFQDTVELKLNYSYVGSDGFTKSDYKVIERGNDPYQYNHFKADRSGTLYAELKEGNSVSTDITKGASYIQAGSGVVTEISFPALKEFLQREGIAINKAELEIEVASSHLGFFTAEPRPILMIADEGVPTSFVSHPFEEGIQQGAYYLGNNTGENGRYSFNLIQYIKSINEPGEQQKTLLLSNMLPSLLNTGNTTILATENNKPKVKLNIVYTKF